jgi:hypothetical protein
MYACAFSVFCVLINAAELQLQVSDLIGIDVRTWHGSTLRDAL